MSPDTGGLVAEILNAAYMVRSYPRPLHKLHRRQAILRLGLAVRYAFNESDDFEPLLRAVLDGLTPKEPPGL